MIHCITDLYKHTHQSKAMLAKLRVTHLAVDSGVELHELYLQIKLNIILGSLLRIEYPVL